jgi:hypothetical protein
MARVGVRVLLGVGAWVLGATTATGGSLFAVDQIGQDLVAQQSKQISISAVNADLAHEHSDPVMSSPVTAPGTTRPSGKRHGGQLAPSGPSPGVLFVSADGSAAAACHAGRAYLVYWSPQQGFDAEHVIRGPAAVAQVTFGNGSGGLVLRVTCRGSVPVKHVSAVQAGPHHDE